MHNKTTERMILIGMMTAVTAVSAVISVPLPFSPVPVTLATLAVLLAGGLLGARDGAVSQIIYLLLGAVGAPVFHNMTGGAGILLGPTGGFLLGYIIMAGCYGYFAQKKQQAVSKLTAYAFIATILCYIPGLAWFIITTGSTPAAALTMAVLPFIPADILKCIAAAYLTRYISQGVRGSHHN